MDVVDHYAVLGLVYPGEEGSKLSKQEITRAYRLKAKEVHPDKRPDESSEITNSDFVRLQDSYELLMDDNRRKLFDYQLRIERGIWSDLKRRREMVRRPTLSSDFKKREPPPAFPAPPVNPEAKAREDIERRIKEQMDRRCAGTRTITMFNSEAVEKAFVFFERFDRLRKPAK